MIYYVIAIAIIIMFKNGLWTHFATAIHIYPIERIAIAIA